MRKAILCIAATAVVSLSMPTWANYTSHWQSNFDTQNDAPTNDESVYDVRQSNKQHIAYVEKATGPNYTSMWWNPSESGWGINFNHQGNILFATLFTYDSARQPLWLVMSAGQLQSDGKTFTGQLYRTVGPAFFANPFAPGAVTASPVGTMTVSFVSADSATLTYSFNGTTVTKTIQKQVFGFRAANCESTPSSTSRASLTNFQDLWWNPAESGWGVNIAHQDNTIFATLFTYDTNGKGIWFVLSQGIRQSDGSFLGDLYMTTGPAFDANPFTPITSSNLTKVGTMRFRFSNGTTGTLSYTVNGANVSKSIVRQEFADTHPSCTTISLPVANPGVAQNVAVGSVVTLDGRGSSTSNGEPLTYSWALTSKPVGSTATLTNATSASPTFVADFAGTYVASLVVSNVYGTSTSSSVTITAAVPSIQLFSAGDFFGDRQVSWPYSSGGTTSATVLGSSSLTIATFRIKANGRSFTIANLAARDFSGRVTPYFSGLANGQVIPAGGTATFSLGSPLTRGFSVSLSYYFTIVETGESFSYEVSLRTN